MKIDVQVETPISVSSRAQQLQAIFDVPAAQRASRQWLFDAPIEAKPWNVGLIVGPSGSGKTTIMRDAFGEPAVHTWSGSGVIDDFDDRFTIHDVTSVCQAVGFNTIPAWMRPFDVLSNGEQFRVTLARALLERSEHDPVLLDEFTSVVDRQVAKIGSNAVARYARRNAMQVVAASCHYDIIEWLQPDWVIEPHDESFTWRSVQPRPEVVVEIARVDYSYWSRFAPFHYLSADLNKAAACFCLFVDEQPVAFAGVLHRPHHTVRNLKGVSRVVTLPDWQGLGLAFVLLDALGAAYKATGVVFHMYPAHPVLVRSFDRSSKWVMRRKPGYTGTKRGRSTLEGWPQGRRPCAVFRYVGPAETSTTSAAAFLSGAKAHDVAH